MLIVQPLVSRELLREGRRPSHFVFRTLFALALSVLFLWTYVIYTRFGSALAPAAMARLGTTLFTVWTLVLYAGLVLFATVRAASLAEERRTGSLPLTRITALGDGGVILGWFLSAMGRSLIGMVLTLPVLALVRSCGGFTTLQLLSTAAVIVFATAVATAFTLVIAARSRSTGGAVAVSLLLQVAVLALLGGRWHTATLLWRLTRESPSLRFAQTLLTHFAVRATLSAALLWLAVRALRHGPAKPRHLFKRFFTRMDRFFLQLSDHSWVLWKSGLGPCKGNPILWRERAASVLGQRDHMIRFWYLSLILTGPLAPLLILFVSLVVHPATAFARERRGDTIALLAVTPLSAGQIVRGKYLFTLRRLAVPLALILLGVAGVCYITPDVSLEDILPAVAVVLIIPLVAAQILYVCASARTTVAGIVIGLAVAGVWVSAMSSNVWEFTRYSITSGAVPRTLAQLLVALFTGLLCVIIERRHKLANAVPLIFSLAHYLFALWLAGAMRNLNREPGLVIFILLCAIVPLVASIRMVASAGAAVRKKLLFAAALPPLLWLLTMGRFRHETFASFMLALIAWRAMLYAGTNVFNRIILSIAATLPLVALLPYMGFQHYWHFGTRFSTLVWPVLALACTLLFLRTTARQLDRLIQRNG